MSAAKGAERTHWLEMGFLMGLLRRLDEPERELLWSDGATDQYGIRAALAIDSGLATDVEHDEERSRAFVEALLGGSIWLSFEEEHSGWLGLLGAILQPIGGHEHSLLRRPWLVRPRRTRGPISPTAVRVAGFVREGLTGLEKNPRRKDPFAQFFAGIELAFGDGWGLQRSSLDLVASHGRPPRPGTAQHLADPSRPLLDRLRHARYRGGRTNGPWWRRQLEAASSREEVRIALITSLSWSVGEALAEVIGLAGRLLARLEDEELELIYTSIERLGWSRGRGRGPGLPPEQAKAIPLRAAVALGWRDPEKFGQSLLSGRLAGYRGKDAEVLRFCLELGTIALATGVSNNLPLIRRAYRGATGRGRNLTRRDTLRGIDLALAEQVVKNAPDYPLLAVRAAEERCTARASTALPPLHQVAKQERWFSE
jgi:hypothetical protein